MVSSPSTPTQVLVRGCARSRCPPEVITLQSVAISGDKVTSSTAIRGHQRPSVVKWPSVDSPLFLVNSLHSQPFVDQVKHRIMHALLALFGLLSSAHGFNVRSARPSGSLQSYRTGAPRLAVDEARLKLIKGGLPQKFAERVSFQSSGQRQAGQEEEILILWREFKKCYPSEKVALQMLSKNTAVILPQLNSPRKIKGTYALLQKRLGKAATSELLLKNPGVLVCSPEGLAKLSDKVGGKARTRMMHVARALKPLRSVHYSP